MNFEQTAPSVEKKETNNLYPERAFLRIDEEIDKIKKIESGEIKKIELSDLEREAVLSFEDGLGKRLEEIEDIKVNQNTFYLDYFITPEGKEELKNITELEFTGDTTDEIKRFFLENRQLLDSVDGKNLAELAGKSKIFSDEKILELLKQRIDENGKLDISGLSNPERVNIILNPNDALEKNKKLRELKKELKEKEGVLEGNEALAVEKIKNLYRKKTNVMIAEQSYSVIWAKELEKTLGEDALTENEKELKDIISAPDDSYEIFSRYDRFIHGVDKEYDESGMRKQVGEELLKYAEEVNAKLLLDDAKKESLIKEKGLDPEKIKKLNIPVEKFSKWAEELLDFYGEKSEYPAEEYDPKRKDAAPDNKWQFIVKEEFKSMSVGAKQKVIKSGTKKKSISGALSTLLGHEFTHFIQSKNKEKIPLRLFSEKMGGFRSEVFSEGGAVLTESNVCKELFGYENNPKPHYIRAMAKKLEGGNFLDCVKTYYESSIEGSIIKKNSEQYDDEKFNKTCNADLKKSITSARRLFRNEDVLADTNSYLTNSKDTVYAEQVFIMKKLRENGLESCAFVKGVNLDTLADLAEIGLIDLSKIERPNMEVIRQIWNEEKSKYEL